MAPVSRRTVLGLAAAGAAWAVVGCRDGSADEDDGPREPAGEEDGVDVIAYGDEDDLQRGALTLPEGAGPHPVVVLVHGGFWRPEYDRALMDPLAEAVVAEGWAAWNVDYRPSGEDGGGGWPTTFTDVAAAVDHLDALADEHGLDLERVAVVGHSAGGTLALWAAARAGLPTGAPGAAPVVVPAAVVSQAGVANLAAGSLDALGRGAVDDLMGGSATTVGDRYGLASPIERLPLGIPTYLVHGLDDPLVPPVQSETYRDRAREAGDDVTAELLAGVDHFAVIDPDHPAWLGVARWLGEQLA